MGRVSQLGRRWPQPLGARESRPERSWVWVGRCCWVGAAAGGREDTQQEPPAETRTVDRPLEMGSWVTAKSCSHAGRGPRQKQLMGKLSGSHCCCGTGMVGTLAAPDTGDTLPGGPVSPCVLSTLVSTACGRNSRPGADQGDARRGARPMAGCAQAPSGDALHPLSHPRAEGQLRQPPSS